MRLFIIIIFSFSFSNCNRKGNTIKGDFSNLDIDKIVIQNVVNTAIGDSLFINDTVDLIKKQFYYKYKSDEPLLLSFKALKQNETIGSFAFYEVDTTRINANIFAYNEDIEIVLPRNNNFVEFKGLKNKLIKLNYLYSPSTDLFYQIGNKKLTEYFIKNNRESIVVLRELFWRKENYDNNELAKLITLFDDDLKNSTAYIKLKEYLSKKIELDKNGYSIDFNWNDVYGKKYNFDAVLQEKEYVLLVFWASWCAPCRAEIPELIKFQNEYKDNVSLVSLSIDDNYDNWKKAVDKEKMPWLNLSSLPDNKKAIKEKYNISAVPSLVLLNSKGEIIINSVNDLSLIKKHLN